MNEGFANFIGKDGFNWWVGQVENDGGRYWNTELNDGEGDYDYSDFDWTNKVKVRIIGYHNPNRKELPTVDLPWAQVLMPAIYGMRSGIGSIQQLQLNSWVVGFFMDGASAQVPIVMGSIADENPISAYSQKGGSLPELGSAPIKGEQNIPTSEVLNNVPYSQGFTINQKDSTDYGVLANPIPHESYSKCPPKIKFN